MGCNGWGSNLLSGCGVNNCPLHNPILKDHIIDIDFRFTNNNKAVALIKVDGALVRLPDTKPERGQVLRSGNLDCLLQQLPANAATLVSWMHIQVD